MLCCAVLCCAVLSLAKYQNLGFLKIGPSNLDDDVRDLVLVLQPGLGQHQPLVHRQRVVAFTGRAVYYKYESGQPRIKCYIRFYIILGRVQ